MTKRPAGILRMAVSRPRIIPEQRHVFDQGTGQYVRHQLVERYVRTIPYDWLQMCNRLSGKTTNVAVGLWFLAGVKKNKSFRLTAEAIALAGCSRSALYHGLAELERAGLIIVHRRTGARPIITINTLPVPAAPERAKPNFDGETP